MRVITIGSDRKLFEEGSAVRMRIEKQARLFDELHIVVFALRSQKLFPVHSGNLHIYPTQSMSRFSYIWDAVRLAKKIPADVLTTQDPFEAGLAGVLAKKARPLQVQLHTDPFSKYFVQRSLLNRIRLVLFKFVVVRADGIRVTTESLKQILISRGVKIPISVLPIFVDMTRFTSIQKIQADSSMKQMLWVGRFEQEKDPVLALEALSVLQKSGIEARLVMLGTGSLKKKLLGVAEGLHITTLVEFPGWKDPAEYLGVTDLVLVTSDYEGYGLSIIEALAAGVPVLSTDVGIAKEAGATVVSKEVYIERLVEMMQKPLPPGILKLPQMSEAEYLEAYRESLQRICA